MIYVPTYNNNNCLVVSSHEVIRVYDQRPSTQGTFYYTDYFYRSNYYSNRGYSTFTQYSTFPVCVSSNEITTNFYYRYDLDKILIIFLVIVIICYYLAFKPIQRLLGRWFKL